MFRSVFTSTMRSLMSAFPAHSAVQSGILAPVPTVARYQTWTLVARDALAPVLKQVAALYEHHDFVVGFGAGIMDVPIFAALSHGGLSIPSTPADLWIWYRGAEMGEVVQASLALEAVLAAAFDLEAQVDGFKYKNGKDLTGYRDGIENPDGDKALAAACMADGSAMVTVQQWLHDLTGFKSLPISEQDDIIGRRQSNDEEFEEAPASAHVKRTAQESFEPEAFVVRKSMPWSDPSGSGLMFVAFGHSVAAFEAQMIRMMGLEDGIPDGVFQFSRALTGAHFWCPPVSGTGLDLSKLALD